MISMMRSEQTVEIHGVTAVVPVDSSATPRRSIPPRLHSRGFLRRRVNLGMWGVIALMVMILCSAIPPAFAEILQDTRYSYDAVGNIEALTDPLNGHQQFGYDDLDRLQTANGPYGNYTYQYDAIGNLTVNPQVSATAYTYPASGPSSVRPHAVTTAGPNSYTYDENGNMKTGAGRIFEWNPENKPICIAQATGTCSAAANKTTFVYDGDGGRVKKIVGTTTISYISKLYECDSAGGCSRFIWAGGQRIATVADNGIVHYWHVDHLGSSSVITDGTGAKAETITYYPYGEVRTDTPTGTSPANVPYKYTGQERDSSTGLMYYEARYYDPKLGRFISADTIVPSLLDPQALNRYTYAMNNPMYYTDPSGHCPACLGFAIGFGFGILMNGLQSDWDPKTTLLGGVIGGFSGAVGFATYAPFASIGTVGATIAGGALAGAAAGYTSGVLSNFAGYNVNVGLAIASGAATGGIMGGGAQFGLSGALAGAAAGGAAGAAISGSDPGMGAAIGAASSAFAMGLAAGYSIVRNWSMVEAAWRADFLRGLRFQRDDQFQVCPAASGCSIETIRGPIQSRGIVGDQRPLWTPMEFSIDATILRSQFQYTMGRGVNISDVYGFGNLSLKVQVSIVSPGSQPSALSAGPFTLYGTYSGGNLNFRGSGVSVGAELFPFPELNVPHKGR